MRAALAPLLVGLAVAGSATADEGTMDERGRRAVTGEPAAGPQSPGAESEELAALRAFEERAFRPAPLLTLDEPAGEQGPGVVPPADVDAARASLLQGLILPDVPIRWDPKVLQYIEWFHRDPRGHAILSTWLRRAGRFETHVRRILADAGLPQDLVFVAMNESGFVPTARSPAGAVGLWQFMPEGGSIYGLRQDHWRDERRDPIRSTRAGAAYLGDLYRRFGDWHLALAAYNMGYNGLLRSIRKYNTNDYWSLSRMEAGLPWETTTYVPKILAAAIIGKNKERFGFGDVRPEEPWSFETVEIPTSCDIGLLARAAGVPRGDFAALNPSFLRGRTPPDETSVEVRIPASRRRDFVAGLERLRTQWRAYRRATARFGETIDRLAHRFRTTARALRELNGLGDGRRLVPGEPLVVPSVTPLDDAAPAEAPVVVVPDRRFATEGRRHVLYQAISGDTISDVARAFGVSAADVRLWNDVSPNARLQSGQWLQLFVATEADLSRVVSLEPSRARLLVAGSVEFFEHHESARGRRRVSVTIGEGETLSEIAERYDLTLGSLCRINGIDPRAPIRRGQEIVVYAPVSRIPAPEQTAPTSVPAEPPTTPATPAAPSTPESPASEPQASADPALPASS